MTLLRHSAALVLAACLPASALASSEEADPPRVLLSDFRSGEDHSPALVHALRDHELRRLPPETRLRSPSPDVADAVAILEAARALDDDSIAVRQSQKPGTPE